jgi:hypothetical protein
MAKGKRTRPVRKVVNVQPHVVGSDCCKPYPDATFRDGIVVRLYAHHHGPSCKGTLERMSIRDWNHDIDRRSGRFGRDD